MDDVNPCWYAGVFLVMCVCSCWCAGRYVPAGVYVFPCMYVYMDIGMYIILLVTLIILLVCMYASAHKKGYHVARDSLLVLN